MKVRITAKGVSPLLMHNIRLANPLDETAKLMKAISGKRGKTEEDYEQLAKLEFIGSMYHDEELGPYIPAVNLERAIVEGARATKMGKKAESGILVVGDRLPLGYSGPRSMEGLIEDSNFTSVMPVRVGQARIMRTRPIFQEWALEADAEVDVNLSDLSEWLKVAGATKGLGDFRPRYGRFKAEVARI